MGLEQFAYFVLPTRLVNEFLHWDSTRWLWLVHGCSAEASTPGKIDQALMVSEQTNQAVHAASAAVAIYILRNMWGHTTARDSAIWHVLSRKQRGDRNDTQLLGLNLGGMLDKYGFAWLCPNLFSTILSPPLVKIDLAAKLHIAQFVPTLGRLLKIYSESTARQAISNAHDVRVAIIQELWKQAIRRGDGASVRRAFLFTAECLVRLYIVHRLFRALWLNWRKGQDHLRKHVSLQKYLADPFRDPATDRNDRPLALTDLEQAGLLGVDWELLGIRLAGHVRVYSSPWVKDWDEHAAPRTAKFPSYLSALPGSSTWRERLAPQLVPNFTKWTKFRSRMRTPNWAQMKGRPTWNNETRLGGQEYRWIANNMLDIIVRTITPTASNTTSGLDATANFITTNGSLDSFHATLEWYTTVRASSAIWVAMIPDNQAFIKQWELKNLRESVFRDAEMNEFHKQLRSINTGVRFMCRHMHDFEWKMLSSRENCHIYDVENQAGHSQAHQAADEHLEATGTPSILSTPPTSTNMRKFRDRMGNNSAMFAKNALIVGQDTQNWLVPKSKKSTQRVLPIWKSGSGVETDHVDYDNPRYQIDQFFPHRRLRLAEKIEEKITMWQKDWSSSSAAEQFMDDMQRNAPESRRRQLTDDIRQWVQEWLSLSDREIEPAGILVPPHPK
jgi:hypothetical protein